jgi:hypothetical protein
VNKQELVRRLTALLSALGVLSGGVAMAQEVSDADQDPAEVSEACADDDKDKAKKRKPPRNWPGTTALYGVLVDPWFQAGNLENVEEAVNQAEEALRWADTPEGRADMAKDAKLRGVIENLRSNVPTIKRRLAEAKSAKLREAR